MNLSNLSKKVIEQIGATQGQMFFQRLSPIKIMILTVTREMEWEINKRMRGKKRTAAVDMLFANQVRKIIEQLYIASGADPYTIQGFWVSVKQLKKAGLLFVAPHKKSSTKRTICLTAKGEAIFTYPQSIQLYTPTIQEND